MAYYISSMSQCYYVIVLIFLWVCSMNVAKEDAFSKPSPTFLTSQKESGAFQIGFPAGMNRKPIGTEQIGRRTIAGQSYPRPSHLLWTLPRKRSSQSQTSGRAGEPEGSHPRTFSGLYTAKRLKGSFTPPLPSPSSSCKNVAMTLHFLEAKTLSPERAGTAETTGSQLECGRPNTLRSPFEYTQKLITSQADPSANDNQRFDSKRPVCRESPSGYIYYAPTNPSEKTNQILDAHHRVPHRQLSYGDPPSKPEPRSLHKATGSWELRHEAERHAEDYNLDSRSTNTWSASAARFYHSEPIESKPRLWLDLSEQNGNIQKAVSIQKLQVIQTLLPKFMPIT